MSCLLSSNARHYRIVVFISLPPSQVLGCDPPIPGLTVAPQYGVVPRGGGINMAVTLHNNNVIQFDSWLRVRLKDGKTLSLRVVGTTEHPKIYAEQVP